METEKAVIVELGRPWRDLSHYLTLPSAEALG
jgi:hypothetical protein